MEELENILLPIFICVVMPISIVLICCLTKMYKNKKNTEIIVKAIENGNTMDVEKLTEALGKPAKTPREILLGRLLRGCLFSLIGIFLCTFSIISACNGAGISDDSVSTPAIAGLIGIAFGISYLVVYFVSRKDVNTNEAEE